MGFFSAIIDHNKFTTDDVVPFKEKLFFEGAKRRINLERFAVLLFLSTVIATYGILGDSTAVIIGAMVIAPLMIPIVGTAAGLVMGDMKRASGALLKVVLGVITIVATATFIASFLNTTVISFSDNSAIVGRISPSITDLAIALASGVAAAFAMSRSDVSDSLPGVAISISLVPPLCVAGIGISAGEWEAVAGSMILFLTNFTSILLAGGATLGLLGLSAATTGMLEGSARRKAFSYIAAGMIIITIPLAATSIRLWQESMAEMRVEEASVAWLEGTQLEVTKVTANGSDVEVAVSGLGEPPPISELDIELPKVLGSETVITYKLYKSIFLTYPEP